ncbi:MAG: kelch repeat-containing protein, partial [candidate division WOR-3 bacterium]
ALTFDRRRGVVLLFGGLANETPLNDLWEWDGQRWQRRTVSGPWPPPRTSASFAFDDARGVAVLFGGVGSAGLLGDTWLWDGHRWEQVFPSDHPSRRNQAAACDDRHRQRVVVFGGVHWQSFYDGTWEWDGSNWSYRCAGPSPRASAAMAYDSRRHVCIMFGGQTSWQRRPNTNLRETWQWDGAAWTLLDTAGPSPRCNVAMAYDSLRDRVVLFGGDFYDPGGEQFFYDSWEWDGTRWTQVAALGPAFTENSPMFFHDTLRQILLYDRSDSNSVNYGVWSFRTSAVAEPQSLPISATTSHAVCVSPNPFSRNTAVHFSHSNSRRVALLILSPAGTIVRNLGLGIERPGVRQVQWDGRDDHGNPVPAGVYLCFARGVDWSIIQKVVKAE